MTGVELIAKERAQQIEIHGRTPELDKKLNTSEQLQSAAVSLLEEPEDWRICDKPVRWDFEVWEKMCKKSRKERLIIAGALIAAEIDRIS